MAKPKKEGKAVNFLMSTETLEKMDKYCEATGSTKTRLIEIAVDKYVDDFFAKNKDLDKS